MKRSVVKLGVPSSLRIKISTKERSINVAAQDEKKQKKKKTFDITKKIEKWGDEELLINLAKFLPRVKVETQYNQDEEGMIISQYMAISAGEYCIVSEPVEVPWPLQPLPMPESLKGKLN